MKKKFLMFIFALVFFITGIVNINAYDKYDGDYTIEYLLRNYNVVTFGTKNRYQYTMLESDLSEKKGSVVNVFDIGGPVLIQGDFIGSEKLENEYAQKTNGVPSYIKGKIGANIKAGSKESSDVTDIYVGSENSLSQNGKNYTVNGDEYNYEYSLYSSDDYLNFEKLYAAVVNEQKEIDRGKELSTYGRVGMIVITEPGNYHIKDLGLVTHIMIYNYQPNELYLITYEGTNVYTTPYVYIDSQSSEYNETSDTAVYCGRDDNEDTCTGNIVWNMPNARYVYMYDDIKGHLIAPKADVELKENHYAQSIIANSVISEKDSHTALQFNPYNIDTKFTTSVVETTVVDEDDQDLDLYIGNYSIDELLRNYSIVTLGQKDYEDNTKLKNLSSKRGTASIFHIAGQFLISGDLGYKGVKFTKKDGGKYSDYLGLDFYRTDLNADSFIKGDINVNAWQKWNSWFTKSQNYRLHVGTSNYYYYVDGESNIQKSNKYSSLGKWLSQTIDENYMNGENPNITLTQRNFSDNHDNYINFTKLYNSIVEQQKDISDGNLLTKKSTDNKIHITMGGNYYIESLDGVNGIVFDDFANNKNVLTIITIKDSENVIIPKVTDGSSVIPTNDWSGGYTFDSYGGRTTYQEKYFGNIVWNIPNAKYVKLPSKAPFVGHVIAPNADLETDELHFAGTMIVNSLYAEGNTEAHFYPPTVQTSIGDGIDETTEYGDDEIEKIDIKGSIYWDDKNNQDRLRPDKVVVNLFADGEKINTITVTADNDWKYEFKDLVRTKDNVKINYTITEDAIDNYSITINKFDITNSYTPEKTSLTVNKVWKDENDKDKIRPESIEVELYANGEKVSSAELSKENDWTYIFTEIDMNSNGEKIEYTIKEKNVEGYTSEINGDQETGYIITNTHKVKEVKPEKENPSTYDNINKFFIISVISTLLLVIGITVYQKNKKEA